MIVRKYGQVYGHIAGRGAGDPAGDGAQVQAGQGGGVEVAAQLVAIALAVFAAPSLRAGCRVFRS